MPALRRFYLVIDQDKNCCKYRFNRFVGRVMEFVETLAPVEIDAVAGYILVDAGVEVDSNFFDGFDWVWKLVEVQNFDKSRLVKKTLPDGCDKCRERMALARKGILPKD